MLPVAKTCTVRLIPKAVVEYFGGKIGLGYLKIQLPMLTDAINTTFAGSAIHVKKVKHMRTITNTLNQSKIVKGMLSKVDRLLLLHTLRSP